MYALKIQTVRADNPATMRLRKEVGVECRQLLWKLVKRGTALLLALSSGVVVLVLLADLAPAAKSERDIYNCGDFDYQDDTQALLDEDPGDPYRLDRDDDGMACEDLPTRPEPLPAIDSGGQDTPLIFVPGIGGSQLLDAQGNEKWPRGQEIYDDAEDGFLLDVGLDETGNEIVATEPGDILRIVPVDAPTPFFDDPDFYESTIERLQEVGYVEGEDLFVFPYDWRKDAEEQGQNRLLTKVDEVRNATGSSRVDILAYSQGGLVTLAALRDPDSIGKIRRVTTLGTPLLGVPKTLGLLGYRLGCFGQEIPFSGCVINSSVTQQIMRYMPGSYQLLPSRKYDEAVGAPLVVDLGRPADGQKPYDSWTEDILDGSVVVNELLVQAEAFHKTYDTMAWADPSVEMLPVAGTGRGTPQSIRRYNECDLVFLSCDIGHEYNESDAGDQTVPDGSAAPGDRYDPLDRAKTVYVPDVEHGELAKEPKVLEQAIDFFRPANYQAIAQTSTGHETARGVDIRDTPQPFDGVELNVAGPVRGFVSNLVGDKTGSDAGEHRGRLPVREIHGSSSTASGDLQSFFFDHAGAYAAFLEVTGEASVQLEVQTYTDSKARSRTVFLTRPPLGATLEMRFSSIRKPKGIKVCASQEADKAACHITPADSTVVGAAGEESDPPNTSAVFEEATKNRMKVVLISGDGQNGSGTLETFCMLPGDARSRTYEEPFSVPRGTPVRFLSADKAGNVERPKKTFAGSRRTLFEP